MTISLNYQQRHTFNGSTMCYAVFFLIEDTKVGMHCDDEDPGVGLPHTPVLSPRQMLEALRKDVGPLLGSVAANGSVSAAVGQQIEDRIWQVIIRLPADKG
jgi:hypothetical protein